MEFSRSALEENLRTLANEDAIVDVRCDAYGHGAQWVHDAARDAGLSAFLTDDDPLAPVPQSTAVLYGISAGRRVAVLSGEIVAIKSVASGDTVSYGNTWAATRASTLALVSLGFADGLPRGGSNVGLMTVGAHTVPVVGRIAMDQCVLDITDISDEVSAVARVWDSAQSVETWATASRRDPLSLVSGLSWRVERRWTS
ncbi:MAG: hypothetical protein RLZZ587_1081 [Actinomycetota bacterium]